jgi:multimeric flavodoxin WrbA
MKEADAVVLGAAVHMETVNAAMLAFISRLWGFRHVTIPIKNKPFVLALSAGGMGQQAINAFRAYLMPYQVNILDVVCYSSQIMPCYKCGRHQECKIGGAYRAYGEGASTLEITPDLFRQWEDHPETVAKIEAAGNLIAKALNT